MQPNTRISNTFFSVCSNFSIWLHGNVAVNSKGSKMLMREEVKITTAATVTQSQLFVDQLVIVSSATAHPGAGVIY